MRDNKLLQESIFERYRELKRDAINKISQLSGNKWNDYHLSDPGITILEQLIAEIIEFEFQSSRDIDDLLDQNRKLLQNKNYTPEDLLSQSYFSETDVRKTVLNNPEIRNAKICIRNSSLDNCKYGYKILYLEDSTNFLVNNIDLYRKLKQELDFNRKIGEKEVEIESMVPKIISIELSIQLLESYSIIDVNQILASILCKVQEFFVPTLQFYSKDELLNQSGLSLYELYQGPKSNYGFLMEENIENSEMVNTFNLSDLMHLISEIETVRTVFDAKIFSGQNGCKFESISCNENEYFLLDILSSKVNLFHKTYPISFDINYVNDTYKQMEFTRIINKGNRLFEIPVEKKESKQIVYSSFQHQFPAIYSLGEEGQSKSVSVEERANHSTLKAYLTIFDQILANYFGLLENVSTLFDIRGELNFHDVKSTIPNDIPKPDQIFKKTLNSNLDKRDPFLIQKKYLSSNLKQVEYQKKSDINENLHYHLENLSNLLNTKLALFDRSTDFFIEIFSQSSYPEVLKLFAQDEHDYLKLKIEYQRNLLKTISEREYKRFVGLYRDLNGILKHPYLENISILLNINIKNYKVSEYFRKKFVKGCLESDSTQINIYIKGEFLQSDRLALYFGLNKKNYVFINNEKEKYIGLIVNYSTNDYIRLERSPSIKSIAESNIFIDKVHKMICDINVGSETIYLIEHSLLVDVENISREDLFTITFVLPEWPARFQDKEYRDTVQKVISEHTPAHIFYNILWLDVDEMEIFENTYYRWANSYANPTINKEEKSQAKKNLLGILKMYIMG